MNLRYYMAWISIYLPFAICLVTTYDANKAYTTYKYFDSSLGIVSQPLKDLHLVISLLFVNSRDIIKYGYRTSASSRKQRSIPT
jgi:hypothetical protein